MQQHSPILLACALYHDYLRLRVFVSASSPPPSPRFNSLFLLTPSFFSSFFPFLFPFSTVLPILTCAQPLLVSLAVVNFRFTNNQPPRQGWWSQNKLFFSLSSAHIQNNCGTRNALRLFSLFDHLHLNRERYVQQVKQHEQQLLLRCTNITLEKQHLVRNRYCTRYTRRPSTQPSQSEASSRRVGWC